MGREQWKSLIGRRYDEKEFPVLGKVRVQSLTHEEAVAATSKSVGKDGKVQSKYLFADRVLATVVDDDGDPVFGEIDREWLSEMDHAVVSQVHDFIMKHCGLGPHVLTDEQLKKTLKTESYSPSSP